MKLRIIFLSIIFFSLGFYYFIHAGFYPVAVVNSRLISAKIFEKEYQAALIYYKNALKIYAGQDLNQATMRDFIIEIRRSTLDNLIVNTLIYGELKRRVGGDLPIILERKMPSFKESAAALYGLTGDEFKELVLIPQAYREILDGRLTLEGADFNEWLAKAKQSAKVRLLLSQFEWNGSNIALRD